LISEGVCIPLGMLLMGYAVRGVFLPGILQPSCLTMQRCCSLQVADGTFDKFLFRFLLINRDGLGYIDLEQLAAYLGVGSSQALGAGQAESSECGWDVASVRSARSVAGPRSSVVSSRMSTLSGAGGKLPRIHSGASAASNRRAGSPVGSKEGGLRG
jgi:hypothetical protein